MFADSLNPKIAKIHERKLKEKGKIIYQKETITKYR